MTEDSRTIARRLIDEDLNTGDPVAAERIIHPDFVDHTNPPHLQHGLSGHRGIVDLFRVAFPDVRWSIDDMLVDGDRVAMRLTMTGTHQGDFFGIPATGRRVEVAGTHIIRVEAGRVAEHWGHNDDLGLMRQLGVVPEMSTPLP